jgi:chromosomal replication initiation ATPase DnaA
MNRAPSRQLALTLPHQPALGAGDFLVGEANREAFEAVMRWPDWTAPVLWLWGPAGSGKSHLVEVWRGRSGANRETAAELGNDRVEDIFDGGAAAVEGIDEKADERALFHLLNLARQRGASLLLTSREGPDTLAPQLPDLASRLRAVQAVGVRPPGDDLLRQVLVKLFADRQILVDPTVVDYILRRMERSFEAANAIVAALDGAALAEGRSVSRALAASVLGRLEAD